VSIDASTADLLVGLIGSGIGPSLSPALHEREARELDLCYRYVRLDLDVLELPPEAIGDLLRQARAAGFRGLNVTHPCKQLAIPHLDALDPAAEAIGAVNTVVFDDSDRRGGAIGYNTDWTGFRDGLLDGLPEARLGRVVLVGAGGAGAAAGHALLSIDAGTVDVLDVDAARAVRLAAALNDRFGPGRATGCGTDDLAARIGAADPHGYVRASGPSGPADAPAPRAVGRRDRLPPARHRAAPRGSRRGLRHAGRRPHGGAPGRRGVPALHRAARRRRPDAATPHRARAQGDRS
jgi:shikimate dehydrogenase